MSILQAITSAYQKIQSIGLSRYGLTIGIIALLSVALMPRAYADDIGITSVRLIQVSDTSYLLEADLNQALLWSIKVPVFPERFTVSDLEYTNNAGWIVASVRVTTSGEPLNYKDEIFLPWMRNGISLAAQWLDGELGKGFFRRSLDGIHIPLSAIMPVEKTDGEIAKESFALGIDHISFGFIHLLLVLALFAYSQGRSVLQYLLWYVYGQGTSLILIELGLPGFDLMFTELLLLLMVFALAVIVVRGKRFNYLAVLLLFLGLLHGLSVSQEMVVLKPVFNQKLIAVFMFDLAIDLIQLGFAFLLIIVFRSIANKTGAIKAIVHVAGILAVSLIVGIFFQNVIQGDTQVVRIEEPLNFRQNSMALGEGAQPGTVRPPGATTLITPIMSYLSVEPFEVRHEILVNAGAALDLIGEVDPRMGSIPEGEQEGFKNQLLELFENSNPIKIDGIETEPVLTRIDFVTLSPTGVFIREEPVRESLEEGILGITLVYETETLAKNIAIDWQLFAETMEFIEATTVDPFGGTTLVLTPEENILNWQASLSGYTVPKVENVAIEKAKLPVLFVLLILIAIVLLMRSREQYKTLVLVLIGVSLLSYPFVRFPLNIPLINQWKPSEERSAKIINGLLTNVYRSFDYRNEEAVYDRLAISVMGDQLTQTYIEQRKGLEIENRGGASAKVDDVDVLKVHNVTSGEGNDFGIETTWTINGSVSHFGHMHYRQNRYRAIIWITPEDGNWKIQQIDMIDEERLM